MPGRPHLLALQSVALLALTLLAASSAALLAQQVPGRRPPPPGQDPVVAEIRRLDAPLSRAVFRACDADGDDRIDRLEAARSLPHAGAVERFRSLDVDRDGFLSWSELRQHIATRLRLAGRFRFQPQRPFREPERRRAGKGRQDPAAKAASSILRMTNADADPEMSPAEFSQLLRLLQQPQSFMSAFGGLDGDGSGGLSVKELAPLVQQLPFLQQLAKQAERDAEKAPTASPRTLRQRLQRMHPSLRRWREEIARRVAQRDSNK